MKKFLTFITGLLCCIGTANAAVRDGNAIIRAGDTSQQTQSRTATTPRRQPISRTQRALSARTTKNTISARPVATNKNDTQSVRIATARTPSATTPAKKATRAATTTAITETRTGAEYEQCKNTYFACMDQFCTLKNDSYRRCSCNDRVFTLDNARKTLEDAGERLNAFTEELQVVGMTAAQATALRTASEGEDALTDDKSASKALLQAIMNSINGQDTNVSGKYADLNSINLSFDTSESFGANNSGQIIASYNGLALYNAVYPQCRNAVRADCNDASLQRAINAYLMAIEQDCNTVQSAVETTQKKVKSAIREGSAMLDLARVENRQKHNSYDVTTCINAVETAILSEEVCGKNYHKCLDNGEFIDIDTGAPIAGIKDFFKLEQMLSFTPGVDAIHQKLAQNISNRTFVENFTNRTKKFAEPALDKCVENADKVWSEYLDKAMLDIYYAQKDKVSEIKQNCFNYISDCYMNNNSAIDDAMTSLSNDKDIPLQPDKITLNTQMCSDYIESCNNMFDNNIINEFIANRDKTDTLTACRAVAKQCFDNFGGKNYENLFYPNSGLFELGRAIDWFTLYHYDTEIINIGSLRSTEIKKQDGYVSQCAQQLAKIDACNEPELIEQVFGGMDSFETEKFLSNLFGEGATCNDNSSDSSNYYKCANETTHIKYGLLDEDKNKLLHRYTRPTGVATEVYYQIISHLTNQCKNKQGRFIEPQTSAFENFMPYKANVCAYTRTATGTTSSHGLAWLENICPAKYQELVDTASWGFCSCWHNGGRRSRWGTTEVCLPILPFAIPQQNSTTDVYIYEEKVSADSDSQCYSADGNGYKYTPIIFRNKDIIINNIPLCSELSQFLDENDALFVSGFSDAPNDPYNKDARIMPIYDKTGEVNVWCEQDAISDYDQVCSSTGVDTDGKCKNAFVLIGDQYNKTNCDSMLNKNNQIINVHDLVPFGNNYTPEQ